MSVPKYKRGLSDMEFFHNAITMRKQFMILMLKDFNVRDKVRKVDIFHNVTKVTPEDKVIVEKIMEKYNIRSMILNYPEWFLTEFRTNISMYFRDLMRNIVYANSIYPVTIEEYNTRRKYQSMAISCCNVILQEFEFLISIIPCDIDKLMPFVEMIDNEIALLKGWRKSGNKIFRAIKSKMNENNHKGENAQEIISETDH